MVCRASLDTGEEIILFPLSGIKLKFVRCLSHSLVTYKLLCQLLIRCIYYRLFVFLFWFPDI